MDQILDIIRDVIEYITALYEQLSASLGDYLLLAAGLGLSLILLLILIISRRRHIRVPDEDDDYGYLYREEEAKVESGAGNDDSDFFEVGPEPVIVFRREEEEKQEEHEDIIMPPQSGQTTKPPQAAQTISSPQVQTINPPQVGQTISPPPKVEANELPSKKEEPLILEQPAAARDTSAVFSGIQPVMDPEPMPDAELDPPRREQPPKQMQKLPYLQSELAHSTLRLFTERGFDIEKIVYQGIYGADFIAVRPGIRVYVQIKERKKPLSDNAVAEVSSYAISHQCNTSIIVSPGNFTRAANKAASRLNVSLWNNKNFAKLQDDPIFR